MQDREVCREIVRQLWPYLDGVLGPEWEERLSLHLEACDDCRSHFDFERAFLDAVRAVGNGSDDFAHLRQRVLAAIAVEAAAP